MSPYSGEIQIIDHIAYNLMTDVGMVTNFGKT